MPEKLSVNSVFDRYPVFCSTSSRSWGGRGGSVPQVSLRSTWGFYEDCKRDVD